MRSVRIPATLLVLAGLTACMPVGPQPFQARGAVPVTNDAAPPAAAVRATGSLKLTIRWPERPTYSAQTIPLRTNSLVIQIKDAGGGLLAESTIVRPNGGDLVTTTNLVVPAGVDHRIDVKAFVEQSPGFDSVPIAQGSATGVTIAPSTEQSVRIALEAAAGPVVTTVPASTAPGSYVTIEGMNFDGWGSEVKVYFGGVQYPMSRGPAPCSPPWFPPTPWTVLSPCRRTG